MKVFVCALLMLMPLISFSQKVTRLVSTYKKDTVEKGQGIIYGEFIQRLGFSSGGFSQDISIQHVASGEVYSFRVKGTFKSAKENTFCYHIPAGKFIILQYFWTKSKWYGGELHFEPVYKGGSNERFEFVIEPDTLTYLGTWHFDEEMVSFKDNKTTLDGKVKGAFKNLSFDQARIELPH